MDGLEAVGEDSGESLGDLAVYGEGAVSVSAAESRFDPRAVSWDALVPPHSIRRTPFQQARLVVGISQPWPRR